MPALLELVAIVVRICKVLDRRSEVFRLVCGQLRQLHAEVRQVQAGHFFVQFLWEYIDLFLILTFVLPERQLRQHLVG